MKRRVTTTVKSETPSKPDFKIGDIIQHGDDEDLVAIITDLADETNQIIPLCLSLSPDGGYEIGDDIGWENGEDWHLFVGTLTIKCS